MDEEGAMRRHILDLANRCYQSNVYTFSGFLSMADQAVVYEMERELDFVDWTLWGGICRGDSRDTCRGDSRDSGDCERRMLRFGSEAMLGYDEPFPIRCLVVRPLIQKFADDLTHRDFLGALMHLGVERDVLGDIIVKDNVGYVFCEESMAEFLKEHLDKVKHTSVLCEIVKECPQGAKPELSAEELVVSSERCDAVVAKVYRLSRSQSIELFRAKRVFVNGRQYENNSGVLKENDVVSVRGFGKFIFTGFLHETKKGRVRIGIQRYI